LNFSSSNEREQRFQNYELEILELMAESIGKFILYDKSQAHRKEIEQALRNSETRNRTLIDTAVDAIITIDYKGTIESVNSAFVKMFGYHENEVIGQNVKVLMDEPYHSKHDQYLHNYLNIGKRKIIGIGREVTARKKDGTIINIDLAVSEMKLGDSIKFAGIIHDVTERKSAENQLRLSEMRLERAQEIAHMGNWEWDVMTGELIWSEETCRIFGLHPDKDIATFGLYKKRIHPEDKERLNKVVESAVNEGISYEIEHRIIRSDDTIRYVRGKGEATKNEKGKVIKLFGTVQDITDIKEAEIQIKEISERLKLATNAANVGIWDWDVANNVLVWDNIMYNLYGVQKKDFSGAYEAWINGLHPDDSERSQEEVKLALEGKKDFNTEFRVMWPDKSIRYLEAIATVQKDDKGQAVRMIGVNRDITDRKNADIEKLGLFNKLQETSNQLNAILDSVGDAIVTLNKRCEITTANSAFLEMFNKKEIDVIGSTCGAVMKSLDSESVYDESLDNAILSKNIENDRLISRTHMNTPDGREIVVEAITSALKDANDNIVGAVKSIRDVTKEAEIDRMKTEFISMVSHELRTPLTSIKGYIDLVLGGDTGDINELQKEFLEIVYDNSERLNNLINDLLDVEKIESGKVELNFNEISLSNVVTIAAKTMEAAAHSKKLK
ncbi:PAS domain S-box protein, partial [candidate division KSB1 bacterium]